MKTGKGHVLIGDISSNMTVSGANFVDGEAVGEDVTLTCAALAYYYSADLDWFKNDELIEPSKGLWSNFSAETLLCKTFLLKQISRCLQHIQIILTKSL